MAEDGWTAEIEQLLIIWAEKASGYAWLHNRSVEHFRKKNLYVAVPAAVFAYVAGGSALLVWDIAPCDDAAGMFWGRLLTGVAGILAGTLTSFQEVFTFKEKAARHHVASLRFLSFFRDINCELSVTGDLRRESLDYVTVKRLQFDRLLEQSPDIPSSIIDEFNKKFKNVRVHKPDATVGLQTIVPLGRRPQPKPSDSPPDSGAIVRCAALRRIFAAWRLCRCRREVLCEDTQLVELATLDRSPRTQGAAFTHYKGSLPGARPENVKISHDPLTCQTECVIKE